MTELSIGVLSILYGLFMGSVLVKLTDYVVGREFKGFGSLTILFSAFLSMLLIALIFLIYIF